MQKETFDSLKKEFQYVGILFLLSLVILKIAFFKEKFIIIFRIALSLFWLFALPGYFIMLYWKKNLEFSERFVIGIAIAAGAIGVFSYYFGLFGLNIKYHTILLPTIMIVIGIGVTYLSSSTKLT